MKKILIIDDEEKLRLLTARIIRLEGFEVVEAADCKSAQKKLDQTDFDLVLCDVKLPDGNGVELTSVIKAKHPLIEIILLTAYGNIPDGVQAIKNGAFDYIVKGDDNNKIIPLIHRALEKSALGKHVAHLESRLEKKYSFQGIIGNSKSIKEAIELAERVAPTDATVLLTGETGTGKEVFANAIHQNSSRKHKSFVAINCAAFSHDLLESEMFGHVAGAFTGAVKDKKGVFEVADGGTIFLDELGEMPSDLQAKLLRVLENGEFIRVGETRITKVDIRIIGATHRDLFKDSQQGHFRQDLYYRLSVFSIKLPALRERLADVELLASFFINSFNHKTGRRISKMETTYLQALKMHNWPGNIRELKNVIERSVILETGSDLTLHTLPVSMQQPYESNTKRTDKTLSAFSMDAAEKIHIQKVLNYTGGNKSECARLLGIGIATLYRKLDEYKITT